MAHEPFYFSVLPTDKRRKARGNYLVQIHPEDGKQIGIKDGQRVVVRGQKALALAKVDYYKEMKRGWCRLDLTIRKFIPADDNGQIKIQIFPVEDYRTILEKIRYLVAITVSVLSLHYLFGKLFKNHPRRLLLEVRKMRKEEVEKNIAVVREKYSELLGLKSGQYIKVQLPFRLEKGKYRLTSTSIRMFHGLLDKEENDGYPKYDSIYLDSYTRRIIGFEEAEHQQFKPIAIIQPDFSKLFSERILYYIVTFFLLARQFLGFMEVFGITIATRSIVLSLMLSLWVTTLIMHLEIRIRTNY